ncbi:MAG TPA: DUF4386 domain-containing protein [Saprospiraceae bacterium]|nr:DUF4386 domain-containing protein [Saprospiraceae bacterium]
MKTNKNIANLAGILFLIAAVAAIIGALLYNPILHNPDYIIEGTAHETQVLWGAFFEIITAFAVIGTPIALFPILKKYNQRMAIATVSFRLLEATMIIIGILSLLTIVTLNHAFSTEINPDPTSYRLVGKSLLALHDWTFAFGPNIALGPSTFMTGYLLYKSKLVPRFISILGLVGGPFIFTCGILVVFGVFLQVSLWGVLLAIPVFLYEMSLAVWLLVKGFRKSDSDAVTVMR